MNLKEAVEFTFANRESWITGKGAKTARINARHVLRILGDDLQVADIRTEHFTILSKKLKEEGKQPATINRITAALTTVITELRCNGIDAPDVFFKRQKEPKHRPGFFTEDEVQDLLFAAMNESDHGLMYDSIVFATKTGCRQGEMLKLTAQDIDLDNMIIIFPDTKNGSDHVLHIHEDLIPVIRRRLDLRVGDRLFEWRDKDQLLRAFKRVKVAAGMPSDDKRVWHSLRASVATWLCERNVPLRAVMGVMNHSRIETTLRYAKVSDRSVAAAIDLL